ncbi:MAG TPA: decaprenyl-phosphate phosphoribosyltransferase [Thermomicrobiales bacterium]|nr:decaprenyl-phosphate phosphoribosyltransferase [Thermomicrobiales bacterium]
MQEEIRVVQRHPWFRLLRPTQWSKNTVVLAALVFGQVWEEPFNILRAVVAMIAFCLISSAGYILNDWVDIESDRHHPIKRRRPLASGAISVPHAAGLGAVLLIVSLSISFAVSPWLMLVIAAYGALMTCYSLWLKHVVIIDVFVISIGFLLRAFAGGVAVGVRISPWLMLCTVLLALFLGFCKRRNEIMTLERNATLHRRSLSGYSSQILDIFIPLAASSTLLAYSVYSFTAESVPRNGAMMITIPLVGFAIFRYLYLVYGRALGGAPEVLLFRDRPLLASIVLWGLAVAGVFWLG